MNYNREGVRITFKQEELFINESFINSFNGTQYYEYEFIFFNKPSENLSQIIWNKIGPKNVSYVHQFSHKKNER